MVQYNATLEYAPNTLEFWLYGDEGEELPFDTNTTFNIQRVDNDTNTYSVTGIAVGNKITFSINPPNSLKVSGDTQYDYDHPEYDHIYSVKSDSHVYVVGKLNLIEIA